MRRVDPNEHWLVAQGLVRNPPIYPDQMHPNFARPGFFPPAEPPSAPRKEETDSESAEEPPEDAALRAYRLARAIRKLSEHSGPPVDAPEIPNQTETVASLGERIKLAYPTYVGADDRDLVSLLIQRHPKSKSTLRHDELARLSAWQAENQRRLSGADNAAAKPDRTVPRNEPSPNVYGPAPVVEQESRRQTARAIAKREVPIVPQQDANGQSRQSGNERSEPGAGLAVSATVQPSPQPLVTAQDVSNFLAGAGDSLTFHLTDVIRGAVAKKFGLNSEELVDETSWGYLSGEALEIFAELLLTAGSVALTKQAAKTTGRVARKAGRVSKRQFKRDGSVGHHANPLKGHPSQITTAEPIFPTATLPAKVRNRWPNVTRVDPDKHLDLHRRLAFLEKIVGQLFRPLATLGRSAVNVSEYVKEVDEEEND